MRFLSAEDISKTSKEDLIKNAFDYLENDLKRWNEFKKSPRHATHYPHGVFELMPCADDRYYTYKYVNGHPNNPELDKASIVATGMLADVKTGYPLMTCDMTILTAVRTAAISAIAATHLAKPDSSVLGLIGTGAQSEFQVAAMRQKFDIKKIKYYDRDPKAMDKFEKNQAGVEGVEFVRCKTAEEVVADGEIDMLTTCICEKKHVVLFPYELVKNHPHLFINGMGGDCPGKTELDPELVANSRIVVEFYEQTHEEGEIQNIPQPHEYDELWEIVSGLKPGRRDEDRIILFDNVGFGLSDFAMMRMAYEMELGQEIKILPDIKDPKDLWGTIQTEETPTEEPKKTMEPAQ
jgi:ornithine cyclodeaminase